jgi:hypothetical protein
MKQKHILDDIINTYEIHIINMLGMYLQSRMYRLHVSMYHNYLKVLSQLNCVLTHF